ncbi:MAG: septum formation protein Maf [Alistipes sp.]|nr:septum formation protein Maf [Alistipes sp.]MBO7264465.1 septum formation protein Maf [Alistipes sp.]
MLLHEKLKDFRVILASASPRRRELLSATGIEYTLASKFECEERYPASLDGLEVASYLSALKSRSYPNALNYNDILITADTVVVLDGKVLGKPQDEAEARAMLANLSGSEHIVVTGVTLRSAERLHTFSSESVVRFAELTAEQIEYYVQNFRPMDKAGAYGIQEWIGYVGIEGIEGSFYNVMGLPVQRLCRELECFIEMLPSCYM